MIAHQKFESPVRRNQLRGTAPKCAIETSIIFYMKVNMNEIMRKLFELQTLEFDTTLRPDTEERIAELRLTIPLPILSHYERMGTRGKKGVALVSHQTCTGCHMRVPLGVVLNLNHGNDVFLCDNCQRYLYLPDDALEALDLADAPSTGKSRRQQLAHAL